MHLIFQSKNDTLTVDRETDQGIETVKLKTPCVISTDLRLNEPRFIALPKILAAKNKPIETIEPAAQEASPIEIVKLSYPEKDLAARQPMILMISSNNSLMQE